MAKRGSWRLIYKSRRANWTRLLGLPENGWPIHPSCKDQAQHGEAALADAHPKYVFARSPSGIHGFADRTSGEFFQGFGTTTSPGDNGASTLGDINCPQGTRAVGFSFLPNDFGMEKLTVSCSFCSSEIWTAAYDYCQARIAWM